MTIIGMHCFLSEEEYKVVGNLCNHAFRFNLDNQIKVKKGKIYTRIEGAEIKLLQQILEYILSAFSIYQDSKTKTIPIDYEYVSKNLQTIKDAQVTLCNPEMYYVSYSVGGKEINEADENLGVPLFLCEQKYTPIKQKEDKK